MEHRTEFFQVSGTSDNRSFGIDDYQLWIRADAIGGGSMSLVGVRIWHQLRPRQTTLLYFFPPFLHSETEGQGNELHAS